MAAVCILDEFEVHNNEEFLKIADDLKPELHTTTVKPVKLLEHVKTHSDEAEPEEKGMREEELSALPEKVFKKDDSIILDFGDHQVGYVTMDLESTGNHQDAPLYLYLRFAG